MNKQTVNRWLSELHPSLSLDDQGRSFFSYGGEDTLTLSVPKDGVSFFLHGVLVKGPLDQKLLRQALLLNLHQEKTRGGAVAFDDQSGALVLCLRQRVAECDFSVFRNMVANFSDTVTRLRAELREKSARASAPSSAAERGLPRHGVFC